MAIAHRRIRWNLRGEKNFIIYFYNFIFFSSPPENPLSYCVWTIRKYNIFYFCTRLSARHRRHDSCFWPQFGTFNLQSVRFFSALFLPFLFSLRERHADRPIGFIWLFSAMCNAMLQSRLQHVVVAAAQSHFIIIERQNLHIENSHEYSLSLSVLSSRKVKARIYIVNTTFPADVELNVMEKYAEGRNGV